MTISVNVSPVGYTGADIAKVTFDNVSLGLLGNYSQDGANFNGNATVVQGVVFGFATPPFTDTTQYITIGQNGPNGNGEIITFDQPVTSVGFWWSSIDGGQAPQHADWINVVGIGNFPNVSNVFLGNDIPGVVANGGMFTWDSSRYVTFTSDQPFNMIYFGTTNTYNAAFEIDNVSWTTAVPEPATWLMLLIAFVGMAVAFRKKRKLVTS